MTAPLGCLQAGQLAFQPALPDWKQAAIAALGFGNLNKVRHCPGRSPVTHQPRICLCVQPAGLSLLNSTAHVG